jgi:homoserine O-acetyltransferase
MARAYRLLKDELGFARIHIGVGGSMGGQQLLEWAIEEPDLFEFIFPIATNAEHSPWGIALNTSQRWCIENDPTWKDENVDAGLDGMKIARSIALLSYRHYETYYKSQHGITTDTEAASVDKQVFKAETYQRYQGEKLAARFNAFSYYFLSQSMDAHNLGRERGGSEHALKAITARALVIGIKSDILFPLSEQQFLAAHIKGASFHIIHSKYGHDGFLLEYDQISELIQSFLKNNKLHAQEAGK